MFRPTMNLTKFSLILIYNEFAQIFFFCLEKVIPRKSSKSIKSIYSFRSHYHDFKLELIRKDKFHINLI